MTKEERKKIIADRVAANPIKTFTTYWMTRDLRDGILDDVKIWQTKPWRTTVDALGPGNVAWLGQWPDGKDSLHQIWTPAQCLVECRVYPDDCVQCIRVGHEPVAEPSVS